MKASWVTRLAVIEAVLHPEERWEQTQGLCALLAAHRRLKERLPWSLPTVEDPEPGSGLGQLLREARQWRDEAR